VYKNKSHLNQINANNATVCAHLHIILAALVRVLADHGLKLMILKRKKKYYNNQLNLKLIETWNFWKMMIQYFNSGM